MPIKPGEVLNRRYRIEKSIGAGGYGEVYLAYDQSLDVRVAVKRNLDRSLIAQEQFQREARLLVGLKHPNLPRVTEHFVVATGEQYLVMDFVDGENLASKMIRRGKLPPKEVLRYADQVCDALVYLHAQTPPIIHRDIKPANIIITDEGKVMLVDFGIFKWFDPQGLTSEGARAITPGYSPPEQYGTGQTDARSDIYALGATLYALLSGQDPPDSLKLYFKSMPLTPLRVLNPAVSEPLARVVGSAMALEPIRRPQSVGKLRRRLQDAERQMPQPPRPSPAAPVSPARPSPAAVTPPRPNAAAPTPQQAAQPGRAPLITPVPPRLSNPPGPAAPTPAKPPPAAQPTSRSSIQSALLAFVVILALALGLWGLKLLLSRDATTLPLPPCAVVVPDNVVALTKFRPWENGVVNQIAYSPDGRKLAVASSYAVSLFEAESLEYVDKHWVEKAATSVAFAPDSQHLAAGLQDGRILLWSSWKETPLTLSGHSGLVTSLAFTTNGQRLLSGSSDGSVRLWEVDGGTQTLVAENIGEVNAVAASPDGSWLAAAGENGALHLWNARSVTLVSARRVNDKKALALAFSPDSTELAISGEEGVVYLVRVADGVVTHTLPTQPFPVHALAFLPDAETLTLALGQANGSLSLWTPGEGGARPLVPSAHAGSINTVAFAPGGRTLASSSGNDTVRLWRVADGAKLAETDQYFGWVHDLAFAPDGSHLAAALSNRRVARLSLTEGNDLPSLIGHIEAVRGVAFAPNGLAVVSGGEDKVARVWESATAELLYTLSVPDMTEVNSVAVAPDGATAASGSSDGAVRLWRVGDGALLAMLPGMASPVWCVAFSPDGGRLAAGLENGSVMVWTLVDRNSRAFKLDGEGAVRGVAFSPDGATLAAAWDGGSVDLWSMADDSHRPLPAEARPTSLAFSPDGQLLVVGLSDGADAGHFRLWRVADGTLLRDIDAHRGAVAAVAFSADGKLIATGGMDGAVLLWGVVSN